MSGKDETPSSIFSVHDLPVGAAFSGPSTGVDSTRIQHEDVPAKRHKTEDYSAKNIAGNVFIWGQSDSVTDFDDEQPRLLPFPVKFFKSNAIKICAGAEHILVLTDSGGVYSWGQNDSGALGRKTDSATWKDVIPENQHKNLDSSAMPGEMFIPTDLGKVLQISAGEFHSAGLLERNIFWICGAFYTGQNISRISPEVERSLTYQIVHFYDSQKNNSEKNNNNACQKIKKISCGGNHIIILEESGEVWGMGYGELGQLGVITDDMIHRHAPNPQIESVVKEEWKNYSLITIPIKLKIPEKPIVDIFTGKNCTFLKGGISGKIFACGVNGGQLGIIATDQIQNQNNNNAGLQNNNNLVLNNSGNQLNQQQQQQQVGTENNMQNQQNNEAPAKNNNNNNLSNNNYQNNDGNITTAIQNNEENDNNNNKNNNNDIIFDFQEAFIGLQIVQISSGLRHTLALTNSGKIYVCGNSQDGCLGIITQEKIIYEPVLLNVFENNNNNNDDQNNNKYIKFISCGEEFSGCVDNEGTGYLWGNGDCYKMANKQEENILVPTRMKRTRSFNHEKIIDMALGYNYGAVISISKERFSI